MATKETARKKEQQARRRSKLRIPELWTIYIPTYAAYLERREEIFKDLDLDPHVNEYYHTRYWTAMHQICYLKEMSLERYKDASRALAVLIDRATVVEHKFYSDAHTLPVSPKWVKPKDNNVMPEVIISVYTELSAHLFMTEEMKEILWFYCKFLFTSEA